MMCKDEMNLGKMTKMRKMLLKKKKDLTRRAIHIKYTCHTFKYYTIWKMAHNFGSS